MIEPQRAEPRLKRAGRVLLSELRSWVTVQDYSRVDKSLSEDPLREILALSQGLQKPAEPWVKAQMVGRMRIVAEQFKA